MGYVRLCRRNLFSNVLFSSIRLRNDPSKFGVYTSKFLQLSFSFFSFWYDRLSCICCVSLCQRSTELRYFLDAMLIVTSFRGVVLLVVVLISLARLCSTAEIPSILTTYFIVSGLLMIVL